ncbi:succinate dehydrogenase, cytochrome b556 subunit [Martelella alba]|uniref:Succinate dehydrogenase cytochrome b556 subunit n=1 Tax=Martelella alba TaxID=2590451 RepID=A0A506UAD5_9HYPH|nr:MULTISPECIES: succinate dehydrogenase, cytochrome b556 subunit [Martelella]TPW30850.1 succinate dehydrogenase, cytochrome b556 subunit [Martelella alba]
MASPTSNRPLSPHLQVYKFIPTMIMSTLHRITGAAMYFGTILLAAWLIAAASGEGAFDIVNWFFGSWLGLLILFGYTWALVHHLLGGLRHFGWDMGYGLEKHFSTKVAVALPVASVCLTLVIWIVGLAI